MATVSYTDKEPNGLATMLGAVKQGVDLGWASGPDTDPGSDPVEIGEMRPGTNEYERRHGFTFPVNVYPLFENGLRGKAGRGVVAPPLAIAACSSLM